MRYERNKAICNYNIYVIRHELKARRLVRTPVHSANSNQWRRSSTLLEELHWYWLHLRNYHLL